MQKEQAELVAAEAQAREAQAKADKLRSSIVEREAAMEELKRERANA